MSLILLVFSSEGTLEVAFDDISIFLLKSWKAEDRVILDCIYGPFGLSLFVFGNPYPRHGPWVLMESEPDCEFSGPTIYINKIVHTNKFIILIKIIIIIKTL